MRHIVLMIFVLSSFILSAGETAESLDSVLAQHRERVVAERKRIEERHANCVKCKGKNEVVDKELCATCHGSGLISTRKGQATISKPCVKCSGKGSLENRTPCPKCCPYVVVESKTQQTDKKPEAKESVPEKQKCSDCSGKGYHHKEVGCSSCKGSGMIYTPAKQMISGWTKERRSQCTACSGKGKKSLRERCKSCNGSGSLKQAKAPEQKVSATKKDVQPPKFDLVKWLTWSAEHGDAKAQYCLGVMYATGDVVPKSARDSEKWLKMSADKKYAFACSLLEKQAEIQTGAEQKQVALSAEKNKKAATDKVETKSVERKIERALNPTDGVERTHSSYIAQVRPNILRRVYFDLRATGYDEYNFVIWEEVPILTRERGVPKRVGTQSIKLIIFNGEKNGRVAASGFRDAFCKTREWISISKKNGVYPSDFLDMHIDMPEACCEHIEGAPSAWRDFRGYAGAANLKRMVTEKPKFLFYFTEKERVLRFVCNALGKNVAIDIEWKAEDEDKRKVIDRFVACSDFESLYEILHGKPGEQELLDAELKNVPDEFAVERDPISCQGVEWKCSSDSSFAYLQNFYGKNITMSVTSDKTFNYTIEPRQMDSQFNEFLIFPNNNCKYFYESILDACRIATKWREVVNRHKIVNLFKEIDISCPTSSEGFIEGSVGLDTVWREMVHRPIPLEEQGETRFWFSVQTPLKQDPQNKERRIYDISKTTCVLYVGLWYAKLGYCTNFGFVINDKTIADLHMLDPQLAIKALLQQADKRKSEREIFK